jgi:hypothetical protein
LQSIDFIGTKGDRHTFRRRLFSVCRGHIRFQYVTGCRLVLLTVIICLTVA